MTRHAHPNRLSFLLYSGLLFALLGVLVFLCVRALSRTDPRQEEADMTRLLELRARHGDALVEFRRADPDSPQGKAAAAKVRAVAAEHNTILAKHPTGNVKPLDTMGLVVSPHREPDR